VKEIDAQKPVNATIMSTVDQSGTFVLGDKRVKRLGYGAMQLAGPGVFGPPNDRDSALAVLHESIASGVNHIDTSDFLWPARHQSIDPPSAASLPC
jgi:hypothetical protein